MGTQREGWGARSTSSLFVIDSKPQHWNSLRGCTLGIKRAASEEPCQNRQTNRWWWQSRKAWNANICTTVTKSDHILTKCIWGRENMAGAPNRPQSIERHNEVIFEFLQAEQTILMRNCHCCSIPDRSKMSVARCDQEAPFPIHLYCRINPFTKWARPSVDGEEFGITWAEQWIICDRGDSNRDISPSRSFREATHRCRHLQ